MEESREVLKVDTSWPFPIVLYTANASYVEVRKASGLAFILLQIISSAELAEESLVGTLKSFGVPDDIHYIFGGELANMIHYEIVSMRYDRKYKSDLISKYSVSDFEITELGKRLFAEGAIPTGNESVKKINIYYDVVVKDTKIRENRKMFRMENSAMGAICVGNVVLNEDDIETYINDNMPGFAFRKGERITKVEHERPEVWGYKLDDAVEITFTTEKMYIQAKEKVRDEFIHKNYSAEAIMRILNAKSKYCFPDFIASEIEEYEYASIPNVEKLYLPYRFEYATGRKNQLVLSAKCSFPNSECKITAEDSVEIMQKCDVPGVACFFERDELYSLIPGRFWFEIDGYSDKCAVNVIVIQHLEEEKKQQIMREVFLKCIEARDSLGCCNVIKTITQIAKIKDYLEQFSINELKKYVTIDERIEVFLKLSDEFAQFEEWKTFSLEKAEELFEELCAQVTIEGFAAQHVLGKKINKIIGLQDYDYLRRISKQLVMAEGEEIAFGVMEDLGYSTDTVLGIVNMFKVYCLRVMDGERINGDNGLSGQCALLGQTLTELKRITGIENPYEDSAEIDFDSDRFIQVMATFTDSFHKLEKYKGYALDQYKMIEALLKRFIELKEVVMIEKEAMKNPKNINRDYINQRLKKSRYKDAICDLHVRLQYELNRLFDTKLEKTYDLLSRAEMHNYLSEEEIHQMHSLRICRNGFQHPQEKREVQYSEQIIQRWCDIIEKLGGIENEPCSED